MQLAKMVVLGSLDVLETASGYDVFQYLSRNRIDRWTDIHKPSIYHSLRQLEKESAIEPVEQIREGKYPEKVLYRINSKGMQIFDSLQEEAFLGIYPRFFGFKLALKFNKRRSAEELKHFAGRAVSVIDDKLAKMEKYLADLEEGSMELKRDSFFIEHDIRLFKAERQWIMEVVEYIDTGII